MAVCSCWSWRDGTMMSVSGACEEHRHSAACRAILVPGERMLPASRACSFSSALAIHDSCSRDFSGGEASSGMLKNQWSWGSWPDCTPLTDSILARAPGAGEEDMKYFAASLETGPLYHKAGLLTGMTSRGPSGRAPLPRRHVHGADARVAAKSETCAARERSPCASRAERR